ncbi:MAG: PhoH family protein [Candidatus Lernaella stagnicola]|nr:PhoH family protein [Candidatus Lernaella stagnicola]
MVKHFVLDTNVLLHNPRAMFLFDEHHIVIPITVIEEIDRFKKELTEIGRNARLTSRFLDELRLQGSLVDGVPLESGGSVRVDVSAHQDDRISDVLFERNADRQILLAALHVKKTMEQEHRNEPVIMVTKDTNLRIKAHALGLEVEDFENSKVNIEELYTGYTDVMVPGELIKAAYADEEFSLDAVREFYRPEPIGNGEPTEADLRLYANQFLHLIDEADPKSSALARIDIDGKRVVLLKKMKHAIVNISHRNREQRFAFDLLLDDRIRLVTLVGMAGTGKTLLALAAGLHKVVHEAVYQRLHVSRPIQPMGRELGYLPGDLEEKLRPWMQPIFDNLEFLLSSATDKAAQFTRLNQYIDEGLLELEALTYIRGRSIPNVYLLIDEAQNLTPHEIKTTITRAGEGTKIVLTGDPYQIDNPYLDSSSNGLTYVVERLKGQPLAGHITLSKGERSPLAELAAQVL